MKKITGILVLVVLMAITSFASITFDATTGKGFVGKGNVQTVLGWNNAQLQANASSVTFTYKSTDTYLITETWATGNPDKPVSMNSHTTEIRTEIGISATLDGDPRQTKGQKQFTGFILNGWFGDPIFSGGTLPKVDEVTYMTFTWTDNQGETHTSDNMPVDGNGNLYTEGGNKATLSVQKISSTGGLYVNYGGVSVLIQ